MNQKFDIWEIYDICASDTGVNIIVQSDDMLNGLCIRLTVEGAELYAKRLSQMAKVARLATKTIREDEEQRK